jgi:hypothetical protein
MSEKSTLSRLLRTADVYQAEEMPESREHWREALLEQYAPDTLGSPTTLASPKDPVRHPLQWHHVVKLSPLGLGLFAAGWLAGNGSQAGTALAGVSPLAWVVAAFSISLSYLGWRGFHGRHHGKTPRNRSGAQ